MNQAWRRRADLNSLAVAILLVLMAVLFAVNQGTAGDINQNRVEQTRKSCRERNEERALFRDKFARPLVRYFEGQRKQTERVPPAAFVQFRPITKAEALGRLDRVVRGVKDARRELRPLNCKARVKAVRDSLD